MARRGDSELGHDPLELLGLATFAEVRGDDCRATDEQIEATLRRFRLK